MKSFRVRGERLVQEVATVEVDAMNPEEAVAAALVLAKDGLDFDRDTEACPPYAYSVQDEATGFDYTLSDAREAGADVGQKAQGAGLETLTPGLLLSEWERKLMDETANSPMTEPRTRGLRGQS